MRTLLISGAVIALLFAWNSHRAAGLRLYLRFRINRFMRG